MSTFQNRLVIAKLFAQSPACPWPGFLPYKYKFETTLRGNDHSPSRDCPYSESVAPRGEVLCVRAKRNKMSERLMQLANGMIPKDFMCYKPLLAASATESFNESHKDRTSDCTYMCCQQAAPAPDIVVAVVAGQSTLRVVLQAVGRRSTNTSRAKIHRKKRNKDAICSFSTTLLVNKNDELHKTLGLQACGDGNKAQRAGPKQKHTLGKAFISCSSSVC